MHAVVALVPGADASEAELIAHCRTLVAGYKTPRSITIRREELPLSATSKIDKIALRRELAEQLQQTVRWQQSVEFMVKAGVTTFVEIGPGNVLTALVKTIARKQRPTVITLNSAAAIGIAG